MSIYKIYSGLVHGKSKCDFLRSIDVFVLPSYFEGLPISLLESMSYGSVPIVTPVGSIPTLVKDGVNGMFVKVKDAESICYAVDSISKADNNTFMSLSENAKKIVFEQFSPDTYIQRLNELYQTCM